MAQYLMVALALCCGEVMSLEVLYIQLKSLLVPVHQNWRELRPEVKYLQKLRQLLLGRLSTPQSVPAVPYLLTAPLVTSGYALSLTSQLFSCTGCDGARIWTRVAFLNMSDPNQNCPSIWQLASTPVRTCTGRGLSTTFECNLATHQLKYSRVYNGETPFINYVDGVSITHGSEGSRQHNYSP